MAFANVTDTNNGHNGAAMNGGIDFEKLVSQITSADAQPEQPSEKAADNKEDLDFGDKLYDLCSLSKGLRLLFEDMGLCDGDLSPHRRDARDAFVALNATLTNQLDELRQLAEQHDL